MQSERGQETAGEIGRLRSELRPNEEDDDGLLTGLDGFRLLSSVS